MIIHGMKVMKGCVAIIGMMLREVWEDGFKIILEVLMGYESGIILGFLIGFPVGIIIMAYCASIKLKDED